MKKNQQQICIAVLLTCYNRKTLTLSCIEHVIKAREQYNKKNINILKLDFYLTDDNCSDGTADAVSNLLKNEDLTIIKADGHAYWAGGMRLAWKCALDSKIYDFFLLLNDDTDVWENLFYELLEAHEYALKEYGKHGIYSGNTTEKNNHTKITFGGKVKKGIFFKKYVRLFPNGIPQRCDIVNANILLVSNQVVEKIGIFPYCYNHGAADNDYGHRANKNGFPVLITSNFCGGCDADNYDVDKECSMLRQLKLRERIKYFNTPIKSIHDTLEFTKRWRLFHIPSIIIVHAIHIFYPNLYCKLYKLRKK